MLLMGRRVAIFLWMVAFTIFMYSNFPYIELAQEHPFNVIVGGAIYCLYLTGKYSLFIAFTIVLPIAINGNIKESFGFLFLLLGAFITCLILNIDLAKLFSLNAIMLISMNFFATAIYLITFLFILRDHKKIKF